MEFATMNPDVRTFYMPLVSEKLTTLFGGKQIERFEFQYLPTGHVRCLTVTYGDGATLDIEFVRDPKTGQLAGCTVGGWPLVDVPVPPKP